MKLILVLVALLGFALLNIPLHFTYSSKQLQGSQKKIYVNNSHLVDSLQRTVIFHGFNAVEKCAPWYPAWVLNTTRLQYLQSWGFNVVRLGIMWAGVEPLEGHVNVTYLDKLAEIIDTLSTYGFYVILDMHQDVFSSEFGTYDGIPLWLVKKLPPSPHLFPWPIPAGVKDWSSGYLSQAVGRAFQALYDDVAGAQTAFLKFWEISVRRFLVKPSPNILGYEIMNEPWAGDIYTNPALLLPSVAAQTNLQPMYERFNSLIRRYDNDTLLFYEPVTWGVFSDGKYTGAGFTQVPGGEMYKNRSVLSYHYYCWLISPNNTHSTYPIVQKFTCDTVIGPTAFRNVRNDIQHLGGASFLTEFGLCVPDGNPSSTATIECDFVMNEADKYLQSWTYWDSQFFDDDGRVDWNCVRPFARVYAQRTAGQLRNMRFNVNTRIFELSFDADQSSSSTLVFVPDIVYPKGFTVHTTPNVQYSFNNTTRLLQVVYVNTSNQVEVRVSIKPK